MINEFPYLKNKIQDIDDLQDSHLEEITKLALDIFGTDLVNGDIIVINELDI